MFLHFFYFRHSSSGPHWTPRMGRFWPVGHMFDLPALDHSPLMHLYPITEAASCTWSQACVFLQTTKLSSSTKRTSLSTSSMMWWTALSYIIFALKHWYSSQLGVFCHDQSLVNRTQTCPEDKLWRTLLFSFFKFCSCVNILQVCVLPASISKWVYVLRFCQRKHSDSVFFLAGWFRFNPTAKLHILFILHAWFILCLSCPNMCLNCLGIRSRL